MPCARQDGDCQSNPQQVGDSRTCSGIFKVVQQSFTIFFQRVAGWWRRGKRGWHWGRDWGWCFNERLKRLCRELGGTPAQSAEGDHDNDDQGTQGHNDQ